MNKDLGNLTDICKVLSSNLNRPERCLVTDSQYIATLVKNPAKHIHDLLKADDKTSIALTTCQSPFYVEYANRSWSNTCGWSPHEILGRTCAFLQGEGTDLKITAAFAKDIRETGYGSMRIHNYRKNGQLFAATVTVFPVYDSIAPECIGSEYDIDTMEPVLTHFAAVINDVVDVPIGSVKQYGANFSSCIGNKNEKIITIGNNSNNDTMATATATATATAYNNNNNGSNGDNNDSAISNDASALSSQQSVRKYHRTNSHNSNKSNVGVGNKKGVQGLQLPPNHFRQPMYHQFQAECHLTAANFTNIVLTSRLSDLLRLMMISIESLMITHTDGRIIHVNDSWHNTCGYKLEEVEGITVANLLYCDMTDENEITKRNKLLDGKVLHETNAVMCNKDGSMFVNQLIWVPVVGGYKSDAVTHYCVLMLPVEDNASPATTATVIATNSTEECSHLLSKRKSPHNC